MKKIIYKLVKHEAFINLKDSRIRNTLTATDLKTLKENKFKKLIEHAIKYSPYYKEVLETININTIDDLSKIPILTKTILSNKSGDIKSTRVEDLKSLKKNSTSGSTGAATHFFSDVRDKREARAVRGDEFVPNFKFLDRQLIFWGAERDVISKKSLSYFFNKYIVGKKIVSTYHLTSKDIDSYIEQINNFRPSTIVGYPSALHFMALEVQKRNLLLKHRPNGIISAGETLQLHQKEVIEKVFKTKIYNRYGCREVGHIANECNKHDGLHYSADDLVIEVIDNDGQICKEGVIGNLLITDLNNYAFPMIRYNIGDLGAIATYSDCGCGSTLPKLKTVAGRSFDIIHGLNGNKVSGTFWTLTFRNRVKGVEAFQIKQFLNYKIIINVKTNEHFNQQEADNIKQLVCDKLGAKIEVEIIEVQDFEYTHTGKFKWITSQLNN